MLLAKSCKFFGFLQIKEELAAAASLLVCEGAYTEASSAQELLTTRQGQLMKVEKGGN